MRYSRLTFIAPMVVLVALVLLFVFSPSKAPEDGNQVKNQTEVIELDPSRFLIRPFLLDSKQVAIALDGGEIPVPSGQVPSIVVGSNILRIVHLSWVHDWSEAETRDSFKTLQELYASEEAATLPALRIYLNPVFSNSNGEAIQRAMLQIFFRSDNRDLYQVIARELATGALAADPEAIRNRVENFEPLLINDWDTPLNWLENDIEKTFSVAKVQQARNAKILNPTFNAQLASMLDILNPTSDLKELSEFIQKANTVQRTWLSSQPESPVGKN